ncbi:tetratricopeptide repeat protein, partial [Nonomuraea sp. NPDC004186]
RSTLAVMLIGLGQLEEAEAESRAVLERLHRVLGEEHPATRASRRNLASALREVGRVSDAEAIERFV